MSTSVNRVTLIGRTGKDPEIRSTQSGKSVASFSIATEDGYGDNKTTAWHNIVCFDKVADIAGQYLRKGGLVYVEGRITYEQWDDKDGNKRTATKIVVDQIRLLTPKSEGGGDRVPDRQPTRREEPAQQRNTNNKAPTFADDDMPF